MSAPIQRILLTGGTGFVGRNLLEDHDLSARELFAPSHAELDLMDEGAVRAYITKNRIEAIIHSAVKPGHRNAPDRSLLMLTNTRMFFNLARNKDLVGRTIVLGSGAIYDIRTDMRKVSEESYSENLPIDEHGFSKYIIEKYIESNNSIFDLRIFGVYGKHEDYQIRFISNMICKALFDLPLTIKQDRKFDYLYVCDLAPIVLKVIDGNLPWNSINVTPDESVYLSDIAKLVLSVLGKPQLPVVIAEPGIGREYSGDNTRLRAFIPDLKLTPLERGIAALAQWYADNIHQIDSKKLRVDP